MESMTAKFLFYQTQFKVLHWHTKQYARHMAYGKIYDSLNDSIDEFIEVYQGKYDREFFGKDSIELSDGKTIELNNFLSDFTKFLQEELAEKLDKEKDTDLLNIRDTILGSLSQLKYLLTLS